LTPQQGFLADTALEFKVITADGVLRTANSNTNSDLFWALRGGGPSAFAVIVQASYKTFTDQVSTGTLLQIDTTHTTNATLFWQAVTAFHGYANYFVDNGLYVYYEIGTAGQNLHVHPFLGIGKTPAQLAAILKPLFDDLDAMGISYDTSTKTFSTFYDLYIDMFEGEMSGNSALTGGWTMAKSDVAANNTGIISAFKNVLNNGAFMVGHMWNAGYGLPQSEWSKSSVNPRFRAVSDKIITIVPIGGNAPLAAKAEAQNRLTNVVDGGLRAAAPNGAAYINEVCVLGYFVTFLLWHDKLTTTLITRPILSNLTGRLRFGEPTTRSFFDFERSGTLRVSSMLCLLLALRSGSRLSMERDCARKFNDFLCLGLCIL